MSTPGHTPDHLSVVVEDGDKAIFIAGDASYSEATMLAGAIDGVSDDEGQAAATLAAIQTFAASTPTIYLPAHDPDAARRLAKRRTTSGDGQNQTLPTGSPAAADLRRKLRECLSNHGYRRRCRTIQQ